MNSNDDAGRLSVSGKKIVFTGELDLGRNEAKRIITELGGIVQSTVNQSTDYLVLGTNVSFRTKGGKSSKQKRAEELQEKGQDIKIISADDFYKIIGFQKKDFCQCDHVRTTNYTVVVSRDKFQQNYVVLDIETTGFSPENDDIIQIAAVKYLNDVEYDKFSTYIKPTNIITNSITKLTGITNEMVENAPKIDSVLPALTLFLENYSVICHNGSFDIRFINKNLQQIGLPPLKNKLIDTLQLSRLAIKDSENYKLETLKEYLKISCPSHNAEFDCFVTAKLYQYCKDMLKTIAEVTDIDKDISDIVYPDIDINTVCLNTDISKCEKVTDYEKLFIYLLSEMLKTMDISDDDFRIERRSQSYLSAILYEHDDFLRFKLSENTEWFSVSVWGCDDKILTSDCFKDVKNRNMRHWKVQIISPYDIKRYHEIISAVVSVSKQYNLREKELNR